MNRGDDDDTGVVLFIVAWLALVALLLLANHGDDTPSGYEGPDTCYGRGGPTTC